MNMGQTDQTKNKKLTNFDEDDTPPGTRWDGNNYSCAYDALFSILFNIWTTKPKKWKTIFQESNQYLDTLHDGFQKYLRGVDTLEAAHDSVRALLHENDNEIFLRGCCIERNTAAVANSHSDANEGVQRGTAVDQEVFIPLDDPLLEK